MKNTFFLALIATVGFLTVSNLAQAASICSVSEDFTTRSNPTSGCGTDDYLVYFVTSCDGEKATATRPTMYLSACAHRSAPSREQIESGYLTTLITQGYHIVGNFKLSGETTIFTLEK